MYLITGVKIIIMDPHRFFGHRNSAYYFPPLNRADPYFASREIEDRVYRVRRDPHYYLPPPVPPREFLDVPRRRLPPSYVDAGERIYRTVRRNSPPPPSPPPPSVHHHHKSHRKNKTKKFKKRSRSKGPRNSEYEDDSPYEYDTKNRDKEIFNKYKALSDEHDSFSDADFGSPVIEHDSQESITDHVSQEHESHDRVEDVRETRNEIKQLNSNSQEANKQTYTSFKLLQDPFLKPSCTVKIKRYDGIVPNNINHSTVQVRDPRSTLTKIWTRLEPLNLPVPQFKVNTTVFK